MTISLVSDITLKSSQVVCDWQTQYKIQYTHYWTAIYLCPVVNFHISGTKWASPGTRDTVGQFRDDPGHSGMVGNLIVARSRRLSQRDRQFVRRSSCQSYFSVTSWPNVYGTFVTSWRETSHLWFKYVCGQLYHTFSPAATNLEVNSSHHIISCIAATADMW